MIVKDLTVDEEDTSYDLDVDTVAPIALAIRGGAYTLVYVY